MSEEGRAGPRMFLERRSYRQRRIMDAARLLPMIGVVLLLVPLMWPVETGGGGAGMPMSRAMIYVFGVWLLLIGLAALLAIVVRRWTSDETERRGEG